jgi:hypothetical protein
MSETSEDIIQQAISYAKAGNMADAKKLLAEVVKKEPSNARAWYLLSQVTENQDQSIYCLKRVLQIAPDNIKAQKALARLLANDLQMFEESELPSKDGTNEFKESKKFLDSEKVNLIIISVLGLVLIIVLCAVVFVVAQSSQIGDKLAFLSRPTNTPLPTYTRYPTYTPQQPKVVAPIIIPTFEIPTSAPFPTRVPTATLLPTPTAQILAQSQTLGPIRDSIREEEYTINVSVQDVRYLTKDGYSEPKTGFVFAILNISITNFGPGTVFSIYTSDFQMRDSNGALRGDSSYLDSTSDCGLDLVDLESGGKTSGCIAFEVPDSGRLEFIYAPYKYEALEPGRYLSFVIRP